MGGMQSGTNSLGDALWMQERQRQKSRRASTRNESHQGGPSTHDRRKLLKRTRSLAVISEDLSRTSEIPSDSNFHLGEPNFSIPRRPQLIPRAKLIDRNSLKDRLSKSQQHLFDPHQDRVHEDRSYHSRSTCDLHTIPPPLSYFRETPSSSRAEGRVDSDRLNILDWPQTPRKYRSHQDLETVSGLIDIVEDNWPLEDTRNCGVYSRVKRKRQEHRSLDSILLEDEDELEYFDVLNLLPLSNVRLELDESDRLSNHWTGRTIRELPSSTANHHALNELDQASVEEESERRHTPRILHVSEFSDDNQDNSLHLGSNVTDEDKCKSHSISEDVDRTHEKSPEDGEDSWQSLISQSSRDVWETNSHRESFKTAEDEDPRDKEREEDSDTRKNSFILELAEDPLDKDSITDVVIVANTQEPIEQLEEIDDYASIWVEDTEEVDSMSRRPQVLKVVDNETTRRRNRGVVEIDDVARDCPKLKDHHDAELPGIGPESQVEKLEIEIRNVENEEACQEAKKRPSIENTRNFFEKKSLEKETIKNQHNQEGRFERIVKETSSIIGKACNAVRGSLGLEARSESSDLGLGSDCGSDTRRRSIDDDLDDNKSSDGTSDNYLKPGKSNLTRSHSCLNSIECQDDGPEFDHIRYKIVKSRLFGKNIYSNVPNRVDAGYDGLMQYLREYSFQELLLDNNVVIIEPVRAEPVEIKNSPKQHKSKTTSTCRIAGGVQKKVSNDEGCLNDDKVPSEPATKSPKQSSLRKHFFYHPISSVNRVNRELIDEELPDPDTVRNVRRMFEATLRPTSNLGTDYRSKKSVSMKDLSSIEKQHLDDVNERNFSASRSRCSSRAKDLTRLFEGLDKSTRVQGEKEDLGSLKNDSKTKTLAQSFEARSENTSRSDSGCARDKITHYRQENARPRRQQSSWDAGSVSSGVSSDYPDTDPGIQCTSSEDEEIECRDRNESTERVSSHMVSQDVLKKIRECGTCITYYGGKIVNTFNRPLIAPMGCQVKQNGDFLAVDDYVKFRLVKSNSCDSRLELTGRVIERKSRLEARELAASGESKGKSNLQSCTISESPSIEITTLDNTSALNTNRDVDSDGKLKREPPVVIGIEPKKDENRHSDTFKADFKLGKIDEIKANITNKFGSALTRWQVNESSWNKKQAEFGKMEFEEFEVLEDSLNGTNN